MRNREIETFLTYKCKEISLLVNEGSVIETTNGVYLFSAVSVDDNCRKTGNCKVENYTALIKDDDVIIERYK